MSDSTLKSNELRELDAVKRILTCAIRCCEELHNEFGVAIGLRLKQLVLNELKRIDAPRMS